jgi:hypothetical protein
MDYLNLNDLLILYKKEEFKMSVTATVYKDANFTGRSMTWSLNNNARYYRVIPANLQNIGIHDAISSAKLFPDNTNDSLVILFENYFEGKYLLIGNKKGSGVIQSANNFVPYHMNDNVSSILLVRTKTGISNEFRLNTRDLIQPTFVSMLDGKLKGTQASRDGLPTITWDMWPVGQEYLNPAQKYIKIQQKLHISIDWWPDYSAIMTYHIYLYLESNKLKGYAARWWLWVEGGVKSSDINKALAPKVKAGMDDINTTIQSSLSAFSGFNFNDLYYLPGNQTGADANGIKTGLSSENVTIVLQPV